MQRWIALVVLCALPGCKKVDPNSAEYWIGKLKGTERAAAITKLGEIKDAAAIDALMTAYKDGHLRYQIVAALAQIGDKKAVPVLLEALQDNAEPKAARLAGNTLLDWEVGDHPDVYVKVVSDPQSPNEARLGALQLLAKFPHASAEQSLLPILAADPDLQPMVLGGLAAEALGKLKSVKAVDELVFCMWKQDARGRHAVAPCRLAINRVGKPALDAVIKTMDRKNRKVEKYARKYKFDKGGLIEAKAAELLGDLADPKSVDTLIAALNRREEMPPSIQQDPRKAQQFAMASTQKTISIANALAAIGDERAVEALLAVAGDSERILQERIAATQQLAFLGSQKAVPGLLKLLEHEPNQYDPNAHGLMTEFALSLANVMDGSDEKALAKVQKALGKIVTRFDKWKAFSEKEIADAKSDKEKRSIKPWLGMYDERKRRFQKVEAKVAAVAECKGDAACWAKKIADKDDAVRLTAAYRLAQGDKATALPELQKHVGHTDLTLRNIVLFGVARIGDASVIPALEAAKKADAERGKKNKKYKRTGPAYDMLAAQLAHRKA